MDDDGCDVGCELGQREGCELGLDDDGYIYIFRTVIMIAIVIIMMIIPEMLVAWMVMTMVD